MKIKDQIRIEQTLHEAAVISGWTTEEIIEVCRKVSEECGYQFIGALEEFKRLACAISLADPDEARLIFLDHDSSWWVKCRLLLEKIAKGGAVMPEFEKVFDGLMHCTSRGGCTNCPYPSPGGLVDCGKDDLMRDAFALLKEQLPRVLTFDEVWKREVMFYDFIDWSDEEVCPAARVGWYLHVATLSDPVMLDDEHDDWKEYGKTWRCWTARPTKEQREAAEWYV